MPAGLAEALTPAQFTDLIAYLAALRGQETPKGRSHARLASRQVCGLRFSGTRNQAFSEPLERMFLKWIALR